MYKLLSINQSQATRTMDLQNIKTQTIDTCFDDSDVVSDKNFDFMEIGKAYECKMLLFGVAHMMGVGEQCECIVLDTDVKLGNKHFVKVRITGDIYYVYQDDVESDLSIGKFMFEYTRKDLIQVNDVLHADLLR